MSLKKFRPNDIIINTMKAHPRCEFFIYNGRVYFNDIPQMSGTFSPNVLSTSGSSGFISLYEYNIDKNHSKGNQFIAPFITKDSSGLSFKTVLTSSDGLNEWQFAEYGDTLYGRYPLSASITREYFDNPDLGEPLWDKDDSEFETYVDDEGDSVQTFGEFRYRHYWALKNKFRTYELLSPHFAVSSSFSSSGGGIGWNKDDQAASLISIPTIFFGSEISPGTVSLKMYYTGTLIGELQDIKRNGELIQVSGTYAQLNPNYADGSGSVAGVVMYNDGFIYLTGGWALNDEDVAFVYDSSDTDNPKWKYFGAGANDSINYTKTAASFSNIAFKLKFDGTTETQVLTMFAQAGKGEANYSNNPTYLKYGQDKLRHTSSFVYEENPDQLITNFVSSSYSNYSASFKRQVYISKVGVYDDKHNLIGIATLSNPILKKEDQDYTFKIRLDI